MTFLPIVERELRVAARRRGTYWGRTLAVLAAIAVGVFIRLADWGRSAEALSVEIFFGLAWLAMLHCVSAGIRVTADCLSEEKREGTLGLLFLTDLRGYDVVLGKLFATSLTAFYGLLAIFPVLAVPLLMGGITRDELGRVVLVLLNTFTFSLAMGMIVSAGSRWPRKARAGAAILVLLFGAVFPLVGLWLTEAPGHAWGKHFFLPSPFTGLVLASDAGFRRMAPLFWHSQMVVHGLTWVALAIACWWVPRSWQDRPAAAQRGIWKGFWRFWSFGPERERATFRRRLLDVNAFYWLTARARLKPFHVWAVFAAMGAAWWCGWREWRDEWANEGMYVLTGLILNTLLKCWLAAEAGLRLGEDRQSGALELLLSTPLTVRDILHGQWLALRRQFLGPVLLTLGLEVLLLLAVQHHNHDSDSLVLWLAGMFMLVADVIALPGVAMWFALSSRAPNRSTGSAVLVIMVLPWLGHIVTLVVMSLVVMTTGSNFDPSQNLLVGIWVSWGLLCDLGFGIRSNRRLHARFREMALQRYAPPAGFLARWFGRRPDPSAAERNRR